MAKENYVREKTLLLDYLKANDYVLYSKSGIIRTYYWIHKNSDTKGFTKEYGSTGFSLEHSKLNIIGENEFSSKNIKEKYLIKKWNTNSIKDKDYFKEMDYLLDSQTMDEIINFVNKLPATTKEKVKLIENLPVSLLQAYYTNFETLRTIVEKSDYSKEEKDKFYIKFFKARKNQLKGKTGEAAENLLMTMYKGDENSLKPYFDFFSNIKNKFNDINLDIEESGYVIFSQRLNLRKAAKILERQAESKVHDWIEKFSQYMAKNYQTWSSIEIVDKPKYIIEIRFYKPEVDTIINPKLTIENYNKKLKEFLIYISRLSEEPKLNFNYIEKWLMQSDLTAKLESKETENKAKVKPNKI